MDRDVAGTAVAEAWERDIVPALTDYIAIPNVSPHFDPAWAASGHMAAAVELVRSWCAGRAVAGLTVTVHELAGRTPLIRCDVPAFGPQGDAGDPDDAVLLYGHLDKQPEMIGWSEGLGPWSPVRRGERLYGRGSADDGYAAFAALAAIEAVQRAGGSHRRCVLLVEASEESGSPDLPAHVDALAAAGQLGSPSLVVCLDSSTPTWDRLWLTTTLRGLAALTVRVDVLEAGMHSGSVGGVVPSSFRVLRALLDRVEDATSGRLLLDALHTEVPADRAAELAATATELGLDAASDEPCLLPGVRRQSGDDPVAALRARTWEPSLAYIGAEGLPPLAEAGNVLRPSTTLGLSFRLPPPVDADEALAAVRAVLEADPPHGARVTVTPGASATGWNAPSFEPWLVDAADAASRAVWGNPARTIGEGGSIPFMGMLGERFPQAQFAVIGVCGPGTGIHGPDEYLHVPFATRLTAAVAHLLDAHARR